MAEAELLSDPGNRVVYWSVHLPPRPLAPGMTPLHKESCQDHRISSTTLKSGEGRGREGSNAEILEGPLMFGEPIGMC